jgi:hypothetical protein
MENKIDEELFPFTVENNTGPKIIISVPGATKSDLEDINNILKKTNKIITNLPIQVFTIYNNEIYEVVSTYKKIDSL